MVRKWLKIIIKSSNKEEIDKAVLKIIDGDFSGLDIIKMSGKKGYFRCRIGKIRIIFFEKDGEYFLKKTENILWKRSEIEEIFISN